VKPRFASVGGNEPRAGAIGLAGAASSRRPPRAGDSRGPWADSPLRWIGRFTLSVRRKLVTRFLLATSLLAALAIGSPARAEEPKPLQLSLFDPVQIVPATKSISGVKLALIYSRNVDVTGLDFSFIASQATGNFKGVQLAPLNMVGKNFLGVQWGLVSLTGGTVTGAQLGLFNKAQRVEGLQFGAVNYAGTIHGIQIGLVNIIEKGGWLPVCIIVNGGFN
jgi:hypothetical protein